MYDRDYFYTIPADGYAPELDLTKADQAIGDGYAAAITSAVKGLSRQPRGGSYDMDTVKYRITVKAGPGGSISPATASVKKGADQEAIIIADEGFDIEDVLVDGASIGKVGSYTFTNVKEEHTIEATFSQAAKDPGDEPWSNPFTDVTGHWALGAIEYVSVKGLFDGTSATTFTPDGAMTRAMLVTVLHRMEISPAAGASQFSDVPDGQWYAQAVAWAAENKIVDGYGGGLFGPNDPVTARADGGHPPSLCQGQGLQCFRHEAFRRLLRQGLRIGLCGGRLEVGGRRQADCRAQQRPSGPPRQYYPRRGCNDPHALCAQNIAK